MPKTNGETCGDYGGTLDGSDEPCGRPAGFGKGPDVKTGRCKDHGESKDAKKQRVKNSLLELLHEEAITLSAACQRIGKDRSTIYRWQQQDEEFNEELQETLEGIQREHRVEAVEASVFQRVVTGDASAAVTIFWLKNKAGWTDERQHQIEWAEKAEEARERIDEEWD